MYKVKFNTSLKYWQVVNMMTGAVINFDSKRQAIAYRKQLDAESIKDLLEG